MRKKLNKVLVDKKKVEKIKRKNSVEKDTVFVRKGVKYVLR